MFCFRWARGGISRESFILTIKWWMCPSLSPPPLFPQFLLLDLCRRNPLPHNRANSSHRKNHQGLNARLRKWASRIGLISFFVCFAFIGFVFRDIIRDVFVLYHLRHWELCIQVSSTLPGFGCQVWLAGGVLSPTTRRTWRAPAILGQVFFRFCFSLELVCLKAMAGDCNAVVCIIYLFGSMGCWS